MEQSKGLNRTFVFIGAAILIAVFVYNKWFFTNFFVASDWSYNSREVISQLSGLTIWHSFMDFGSVLLSMWRYPLAALYGVLGFLGFDTGFSDKLFFLWPIAILSVVVSFFFVKHITKSNIGAFIGSILFCYNSYYISINMAGHLGITVSGILSLLAFYLFIIALDKKDTKYYLLTTLTMILVGIYDFRLFYISTFILIAYFIYHLVIIEKIRNFKEIFLEFKYPSFFLIITGLLSLYWVLPVFGAGNLVDNTVLSREMWNNSPFSIADALTLHHPFWNAGQTKWFVVAKIPIFFWLIPIFAICGLYVGRKNKKILFFGILAILGIFLSKQIGEPFPQIYDWLYGHLIGFGALRDASKFIFLTVVGYSVLIGYFVTWCWDRFREQRSKILLKYIITGIIFVIFISNTWFIVNGSLGNMYVERSIPADTLVLKDFILSQKQYFRTLWVPDIGTNWGIFDFSHPASAFYMPATSSWNNFNLNSGEGKTVGGRYHLNIFEQDFSEKLLDVSSFKYIIIPNEDKTNILNAFRLLGKDKYDEAIESLSYLKKVDIGTKDLVVYENEGYYDHLYVTKEQESIYKKLSVKKVDYKFINSSSYKIDLKGVKGQVYLNFSEAYHPGWELRLGKSNWFDLLFSRKYLMDTVYHTQNDAGLNSFLVDSEYIKKNFDSNSYKENLDGSVDVELTLYFRPQSYFYIGSIVSVVTLFGCVWYLVLGFIKRKNKNHE